MYSKTLYQIVTALLPVSKTKLKPHMSGFFLLHGMVLHPEITVFLNIRKKLNNIRILPILSFITRINCPSSFTLCYPDTCRGHFSGCPLKPVPIDASAMVEKLILSYVRL